MQRCLFLVVLALLASGLLLPGAAWAQHNVLDEDFTSGISGWSGSPDFFWDDLNGHLTTGGAVRNLGIGTHFTRSPCIVVEDEPLLDSKYRIEASLRANQPADVVIWINTYFNDDCTNQSYGLPDYFNVQQDVWKRVTSEVPDTPTLPLIRSVQLEFQFQSTGIGFFSSFVDDVQLTNRGPKELLANTRFHDEMDPWIHWWGDLMDHDPNQGDITASGAGRMTGEVEGFAGIGSPCFDLSTEPDPNGIYFVGGSIKPSISAVNPIALIVLYLDTETGCTSQEVNKQFLDFSAVPGTWSRIRGTYDLPDDVQSIRFVLGTTGTPETGVTLFDDVTFYSTGAFFTDGFESGNTSGWSSLTP